MKLKAYNGGKSGAGVYQTIINQQPKHDFYLEAFLGHGGIMRKKKPAQLNIGIDKDESIIKKWNSLETTYCLELLHGDAIEFLEGLALKSVRDNKLESKLIYVDPPYVRSARKSERPLYKHELTDQDHLRLLQVLKTLPYMVQISGYPNELYAEELRGWRRVEFQAKTRQGMATEMLWMNYPEPTELHTLDYVGSNYRERERIKKKRDRWERRFREMPALERQVIAEALANVNNIGDQS
jgi:DNA adenine methylase